MRPKKQTITEHPSLCATNLLECESGRKRCNSLDGGRATSEWETVVADDEFVDRPEISPKRRNIELVFHAHDILDASRKHWPTRKRRNTILLPQYASSEFPRAKSPSIITVADSFLSSSSIYSFIDDANRFDEESVFSDANDQCKVDEQVNPHGSNCLKRFRQCENVARCSRASSSTSGDPFMYDRDVYSGFLQPSAERAVSDALHLIRGSSTTRQPFGHVIELRDLRPQRSKVLELASFYDAAAIRSA